MTTYIFFSYIRTLLAAIFAMTVLATGPVRANGDDFSTTARQAFVMEPATGSILFQRNADKQLPPASMSKLMTLLVIFKALKSGKLRLTDEFVVSEDAWRRGGAPSRTSSMFVPINTSATLEQMIRGLIIQSGNDAAIAIAEGMAGSEPAFAKIMNQEARAIGLKNSSFANATGLPHPRHLMSARDLAHLASHLITTYPEYYKYFAERDFRYRKFRFINRNRLLFQKLGVDGLKTGYTKAAGHGIVFSAVRNGRRIIGVLGGFKTKNERWAEARRLVHWSFDAFAPFKVYDVDEVVGHARVWGGAAFTVPLIGQGDVRVWLRRQPANQRLRGDIVYRGPLKPPIKKGDKVAVLRVRSSVGTTSQVPLFAAKDIERGGLIRRGLDSLIYLALGWLP